MNFKFSLTFFGFEYFIGLLLSAEAAIENYCGKRAFLKLGSSYEVLPMK